MRQQPDEFFKRIVAAKNHTVETTAHESQFQPSELSTASSNRNLLSSELLSLAIFGVFVFLYVILYRKVFDPKEMRTPYQYRLSIPCKHCRFYSPNSYLQCAVHPSRVLKFDAVHCPDYCPRYDDGSYRNPSSRK